MKKLFTFYILVICFPIGILAQNFADELNFKSERIIYTNEIFWDFAQWEIRPDVAIKLNKIVAVLKSHPEIHLNMVIFDAQDREYSARYLKRKVEEIENQFNRRGLSNFQFDIEGVEILVESDDEFVRLKRFVLLEFNSI